MIHTAYLHKDDFRSYMYFFWGGCRFSDNEE